MAFALAAAASTVTGTAVAAPAAVEEYVLDIPTADDDQHPQNDNADSAAVAASSPEPAPTVLAPTEEPDPKRQDEDARTPDRDSNPARPSLALAAHTVAGDSPISAITRALTSGSQSGTGPLLPIVLGLALAGALATVIARRRESGG